MTGSAVLALPDGALNAALLGACPPRKCATPEPII
jgi:hypothetical protein